MYCLIARAGLSLEQGILDAKAKFGWPALELLLQRAFLRIDRKTHWPELDPPAISTTLVGPFEVGRSR